MPNIRSRSDVVGLRIPIKLGAQRLLLLERVCSWPLKHADAEFDHYQSIDRSSIFVRWSLKYEYSWPAFKVIHAHRKRHGSIRSPLLLVIRSIDPSRTVSGIMAIYVNKNTKCSLPLRLTIPLRVVPYDFCKASCNGLRNKSNGSY